VRKACSIAVRGIDVRSIATIRASEPFDDISIYPCLPDSLSSYYVPGPFSVRGHARLNLFLSQITPDQDHFMLGLFLCQRIFSQNTL
jgi:hypothetical protein